MKTLRTCLLPLVLATALLPACGSSGNSAGDLSQPTVGGNGGSGVDAGDTGGTGATGGTGGSGGTAATGGSGGTATGGTGGEAPCTNGDQQSCGTDVGACVAGYRTCANGVWGNCLGGTAPAQETCDGLDHDCDGVPNNPAGGCACQDGDTQSCYDGPAGTEGVGTCAAGTQTCVDGQWGECVGQVMPKPGACNEASCTGEPNPGCTCVVGATEDCYDGSAGTAGVGSCVAGTRTCESTSSGSTWGACEGEVIPEAEGCDGKDHNCNGTPNDVVGGCACAPGATQSCYTGPASTENVGTCKAGTQTCALNGGLYTWGPCTGDVAPVPGDCDHASCTGPSDLNAGCACLNGATQSCYTGPSGTLDVGACTAGTATCVNGAWGACTGQVVPTTLDACVPPGATYTSNGAADLNCNQVLDRHDPQAVPTITAPTGAPVTPLPAGVAAGIQVLPLDTAVLHGAATDQDGAGGYNYRWRLISAPAGNTAGLSGAPGSTPADISSQTNPTLFAQLVGDYIIGVRATDATGCESEEAQVLLRVKPNTAVHVQLTWDNSVDMDLRMVQGATSSFDDPSACYWGYTNPDWGTVDPSLDIDDLAGCNPENIHFGEAGGAQPQLGTSYGVFVHYYCDFRGHRFTSSGDPTAVCYEDAQVLTPVTATVRIYIDGQLAKVDGTNQDAVFTQSLEYWDAWKPVNLVYDAGGIWRVQPSSDPLQVVTGCDGTTEPTCLCGGIPNTSDPYCGPNGAACRSLYP